MTIVHNSARFRYSFIILIVSMLSLIIGCTATKTLQVETKPEPQITVEAAINNLLKNMGMPRRAKVDTLIVKEAQKGIEIRFSYETSFFAFREESLAKLTNGITEITAKQYPGYTLLLTSGDFLLEDFIPNYYRSSRDKYSMSRIPSIVPGLEKPITQNISKPLSIEKGLFNRNIILWHSHGWYYSNDTQRWEWQRPRLFEAVEDLVPASFVIPYLVPMLQNAGASVWLPRERSFQLHEVVVDNDEKHSFAKGNSIFSIEGKEKAHITNLSPGFMMESSVLDTGQNPFTMGTYLQMPASVTPTITISYIPDIPEKGMYPIYISYAAHSLSSTDVSYTVYHSGGETTFLVNQSVGGGTWVYLGEFLFEAGINKQNSKVVVSNKSAYTNTVITTDAVRFGAGMGVVSRNGKTSGMPKYIEGSRYWLQYAGMPDTVVYNFNRNRRDYNDDYMSRAEYGNYLYGSPYGPTKDPKAAGLGIPMDLSLAFHTDAGITKNDSIIGTLLIYSSLNGDSTRYFPDGVSRMANRDFADILQTQIVSDIRNSFDTLWTKRELRDAEYSEAWRPNFPSALLELLSHQNFADMILFKDPQFRFTVARAIYKAMLRFLSAQYNIPYVVQPLGITHFSAALIDNKTAGLSWKPAVDSSESTSVPNGYFVYIAKEDGGFDNGTFTTDNFLKLPINEGTLYRFKVSAVNDGGESFPSEELAIYSAPKSKGIIAIINAFDRISGPMAVRTHSFAGFVSGLDAGVPDKYDLAFTGYQYDFNPESPYISNDRPGHGSSATDYEKRVKAGNTFDNAAKHGRLYKKLGYSFASASDEALEDTLFQLNSFLMTDIIFEKEKTTQLPGRNSLPLKYTAITPRLMNALSKYLDGGGTLFLSGAYIGSDLNVTAPKDTLLLQFAASYLKWRWGAGYAQNGFMNPVRDGIFSSSPEIKIDLKEDEPFLKLQSADSFVPVAGGKPLLRYATSDFAAAVGFKGNYKTLTLGLPLLSVYSERDQIMILQQFLEW